ncbi:hypothetical protein AX15_007310 [Amanita polypyramis BW_CC]|nr:hypothetical protein AX15_007310 [Amanita polypyramis BW_CC]
MAPSGHLERRPASSASYQSVSSALVQRPPSSLSTRPRSISNVSTSRPQSRIARRPSSRHGHRARLQPLAQTLVAQIMGLREEDGPEDPDGESFRTAVDSVLKNLDSTTLNKGAVSMDLHTVSQQIHGHALKARINSNDALSDALQISYQRVKASVAENEGLDQGFKMSRLPDHFQFLVNLSQPPSASTLAFAEDLVYALRNPPPAPKPLTWADILAEEPFEGEHWEGVYGMPPGIVRGVSRDAADDWDTTPSLSPLESYSELDGDDANSSAVVSSEQQPMISETHEPETRSSESDKMVPPHTIAHRQSFENMKLRQYWRVDWRSDIEAGREFDLRDASTLGPSLDRILSNGYKHRRDTNNVQSYERYISEYDAVREVLMALQGRKNQLYAWKDGAYTTTTSTPRLAHLSAKSQNSILMSLASSASTVRSLSVFCSKVLAHSQQSPLNNESDRHITISRTVEAFADAVDAELRIFDQWCSAREENMCRALGGVYSDSESSPGLIVSLLDTEKAVRDRFGPAFIVLLEVVRSVVPELLDPSQADGQKASLRTRGRAPSIVMAALMDTLFACAQEHIERGEEGDIFTGGVLMRVFVRTAEPVWTMIEGWLRDGMGLGIGTGNQDEGKLDDEFFIESNGLGIGMMGSGLLDPDFWKDGYSLREGVELSPGENVGQEKGTQAIPMFLEHVAMPVLRAGKTIGLLRALGILPPTNSQNQWMSFGTLVGSNELYSGSKDGSGDSVDRRRTEKLFAVSVDTLSRLIYDELTPRCETAGALLARILTEECDLWGHLKAIEDLYLMRRGDAMSHFTDLVFAKMDTQQPWGDFHFLNSAFADTVAASISTGQQSHWIRPSLVRFSYRNNGNRDRNRSIDVTVRALDGLSVDYAVPFPLAYIFRPVMVQVYCEIFVFLIQARRAKNVLERILVRGAATRHELKPFYAFRGRLSWFIK